VLKTKVSFKIEANFPFPINDPSEFTVNMTLITISTQVSPYYKRNQNSNIRRLNVIAAHEGNSTIETMFGGAYSGVYSVQIRHSKFGLIDTAALRFTVGSEVASYSPQIGSIYGGTLLTINGNNWSKDKLDNPVSVVFNGALGASLCYVKTTSES
jgi:hypothetical protein